MPCGSSPLTCLSEANPCAASEGPASARPLTLRLGNSKGFKALHQDPGQRLGQLFITQRGQEVRG